MVISVFAETFKNDEFLPIYFLSFLVFFPPCDLGQDWHKTPAQHTFEGYFWDLFMLGIPVIDP